MRQHKFKICKYLIVFILKTSKNKNPDKVNIHHKFNQTKIKKNSMN